MMHYNTFNSLAPKKTASVDINNDLLREAKARHINLSKVLEERLIELLQVDSEKEWYKENKTAIQLYNRRIKRSGAFGDNIRRF